jgi:hypothetical protein
MPDDFPAALQQFVEQHIESLAELDALLLLREDPSRTWTPVEAAKALYTVPEMCASQLASLAKQGLVVHSNPPDAGYRYQPASAELDHLIDELAVLYGQRRVAVITLIYSKPSSKMESIAAEQCPPQGI